ncbi:MAG: hypothetical protein U5N58_08625 [Actinomycetota bacterium]|nr:hypothetical protein [Actinomycetota bacterium]
MGTIPSLLVWESPIKMLAVIDAIKTSRIKFLNISVYDNIIDK